MRIQTHSCDVCSIHKKDANHWWRVYRVLGGALVLEWDAEEPDTYIGDGPVHLCGIEHVLQWLSKFVLEIKQ